MASKTTIIGAVIGLTALVVALAGAGLLAVGLPFGDRPSAAASGAGAPLPGLSAPSEAMPAALAETPSFLTDSGDSVSLQDFRGKIVVLNFWATWCPPCVREMPSLDRLQALLGGAHFAVVAVAAERAPMDRLRAFYDQQGLQHLALYQDPEMALSRAVGVEGLPTTLVLDAEGRVLGRHTGYADWADAGVVDWLRAQIARLRTDG